MKPFVITVEFRVKPNAMQAFRKLIDENARQSCRSEPGCRRFDVLAPATDAGGIFLYEIYDDRAAFDAHMKTAHFKEFNEKSADLVLEKRVLEYNLVCEGSQADKM